jgi:uncharacterized protein YbcI
VTERDEPGGKTDEPQRAEEEHPETPLDPDATTEPTELISRELERIHLDSYGTGADQIQTYLVNDEFVLCIVDNEITTAEQTLLDAGKGEAIKTQRMAYQEAIESTFKAVVERAVGRKVDAFVSHVHLDPMFTVEMFRLAPRAEPLQEPE